jgi:radical SAM protein (TIGR04043 family)
MIQATNLVKNKAMNKPDSLARIKAELQSRGVQIPEELIGELETKYNAPSIKTGRMVLCLEATESKGELVPAFIVNGKRAAASPLHLVKNDSNEYEVWKNDEKYTDITLLPRPEFYDSIIGSGIPGHKLAVIVGPGHLRSVVNQRCYYHQTGEGCRFCAVQHWWDANIKKALPEIADTVAAAVSEGVAYHISLTTATLNTEGKGLEHLVETAKLIQSRTNIPIMLEFEPIDDYSLLDSLLKEARQAGVTTVSCNIECFDEGLRQEVMPAKGRIPVATYISTWVKCLEIFGENEVFTVAVVGIGEEDESILKGVEMAASHGVMTFLVPHSPATGAAYEDMEAPGADRMLSLYKQAVAIYKKRGLDLCACQAGCVRGGGFSAIKDVARFGTRTNHIKSIR